MRIEFSKSTWRVSLHKTVTIFWNWGKRFSSTSIRRAPCRMLSRLSKSKVMRRLDRSRIIWMSSWSQPPSWSGGTKRRTWIYVSRRLKIAPLQSRNLSSQNYNASQSRAVMSRTISNISTPCLRERSMIPILFRILLRAPPSPHRTW